MKTLIIILLVIWFLLATIAWYLDFKWINEKPSLKKWLLTFFSPLLMVYTKIKSLFGKRERL